MLQKIRRWTDFEALKLWKGWSGQALVCRAVPYRIFYSCSDSFVAALKIMRFPWWHRFPPAAGAARNLKMMMGYHWVLFLYQYHSSYHLYHTHSSSSLLQSSLRIRKSPRCFFFVRLYVCTKRFLRIYRLTEGPPRLTGARGSKTAPEMSSHP